MRILLDSTYLFPLIGVRVRGLDPLLLLELKPSHRLRVSDISLFELSAKGRNTWFRGSSSPRTSRRGFNL